MPVLRNASHVFAAALQITLSVFLLLGVLDTALPAQTDVNDVHVVPRRSPIALSDALVSSVGGLHLIKSDVNLVLVPVSVTDPLERLVTGLNQENFQLFEGKKPQEIRHFSSEDVPISVGIILDASGSMGNKMDRVREAVSQFCDAANPRDEFFMVMFSDEPRVATDFTFSPEDLERDLLFTKPKGRTALLDAIYLGLHMMDNATYAKKALLIISDGGDNHSRYTEKEIKTAARESDVMVYAVGTFDRYAPTQEEMLGPGLLSQIASSTGGRSFVVENAVALPEITRRIGAELRTQYVLGYRPQDVAPDGKWHKIQVKLRLPKKFSFLRAHARSGYYAASR
ncbi:MAG TPA: VWA domain-containing protein [Candidatus Sulfotelmatobacter sp.]|jgi:Ca-activated chloride channel family protein